MPRPPRRSPNAEYDLNVEANKKHPGHGAVAQMQELWLKVKQATCRSSSQNTSGRSPCSRPKGYKAKVSIGRRRDPAPADQVSHHGRSGRSHFRAGEWVEPGNPCVRIVRLDRLRIEGFLNVKDFSPSEVGQPHGAGQRPAGARAGPKPSRARSCSSIRWSKPAATTACGPKWTTARKRRVDLAARAGSRYDDRRREPRQLAAPGPLKMSTRRA